MLNHEVLYIHPYGHLNELVVPSGALTCLNSLTVPKLGRYAFEVTDPEIRAAKVVAMDVHWALAITGFEQMVRHVKRIHPEARVIVGGVTAGHFATELLERYPVDYVVRGDSELSFARLVSELLEGQEATPIPNVYQRGAGQPMFRRMSEAEFDATDCITADWFPTYTRVSTWDAVAFPQGRTIAVTRGCAFACPECYGSYGATFGRGYLMRSPQGVVALLRRAEAMRLRNIRMFVAKPSAKRLSAFLKALAAAGPFRFGSSVGFYLCMPPSAEDLAALDTAFDHQVALSMVPPEEHVPALKPKQLASETRDWFRVADEVSASENLLLDVWNTTRGQFERTRAAFEAATSAKVKVSFGAVWSVTRPTDSGERHGFDTVREAVGPLWTFYLARLLSPALTRLLEPFVYLDELQLDPDGLTRPDGVLGPFFDLTFANWKRHRLPTLPGLGFSLVGIRLVSGMSLRRETRGIRLHGQTFFAEPGYFSFAGDAAYALVETPEPAGIRLHGRFEHDPATTRVLAFVPTLPGCPIPDAEERRKLGAWPLVAVPLPADGKNETWQVNVYLRAQEVYLEVITADGGVAARGRADMCYFRKQGSPEVTNPN